MSIKRIKAVLLQEVFITMRSMEIAMDLLIFPLINIIVFGFLSLYLSGNNHTVAGSYVLLGMLLWQIIWIIEYSVSVGSLWNIWSRNLSNMFIAPLLVKEYILAHVLSGVLKAIVVLLLSSLLSIWIFHFNILSVGFIPLFFVFLSFGMFAFAFGIMVLGLIFRFGTRIQAFAWGVVPIFQPLSGAFYPISVLPEPLRVISYLFPPTFTFEAARYSMVYHKVPWGLFGMSFGENIIYVLLGIWVFSYMFGKSKETGQFARNES